MIYTTYIEVKNTLKKYLFEKYNTSGVMEKHFAG